MFKIVNLLHSQNSEYVIDRESQISHFWGKKVTNKQGGCGVGGGYSEPCVSGLQLEVSVWFFFDIYR